MKKQVYRVTYTSQNKVHEIYVRRVVQSELFGFVELEGMLFGEKSSLLLDPGEEQLKHEFSGVKRTYLPYACIIRIDEVEKEGTAKVVQLPGGTTPPAPAIPFPVKGPGKS